VRVRDEPSIFPQALCCAGCRKPWEKWCRGCNLVYCGDHADRKSHNCKPDEKRSYPPKEETPPPANQEPSIGSSLAPPAQTSQLDLFGTPPPNGVASPPNAH